MKRFICGVIAILLLFSGCGGKNISPESTVPTLPAATIPTETEPFSLDYVGEQPTRQEFATFFINYTYHDYEDFPNVWEDPDLRQKIHYIGAQDNYACVYVESVGTMVLIWDIIVYRFTYAHGQIQITDRVTGECPISDGLSVNLVKADGKYIYYGAVSDSHWNHQDGTKIPIDWKLLRMIDEKGNSVDIDMVDKLAYLCVLDAPLKDFWVINQNDEVCVTYLEYLQQGWLSTERDFQPIEE